MKRILFVVALLFTSQAIAKKPICLIALDKKSNEPTIETLISKLTNEGVLEDRILKDWIRRLESGQNARSSLSSSLELSDLDSSTLHYKTLPLQEVLRLSNVENTHLIEILREKVSRVESENAVREEAVNLVASHIIEPKFIVIKPKRFPVYVSRNSPPKNFKIPKPILIMDIPVTQYMWSSVASDIPQDLILATSSPIEVEVNGKILRMNPNHPVVDVTWYSAAVFANQLSERMGLPKAFSIVGQELDDFESWRRGEWEGVDRPYLHGYKQDTVEPIGKGATTDELGFRFPTALEQTFLTYLATRGPFESWVGSVVGAAQTNGPLEEVASRAPILINGQPVYDLIGNTMEWVADGGTPYIEDGPRRYLDETFSMDHPLWPAGYRGSVSDEYYETTPIITSFSSSDKHSRLGFRLVRTLTPEEYFEITGEEL